MRLADLKPGMRVAVSGHGTGEVLRVGFATVWVEIAGDFGRTQIVTAPENLRPAERSEISIGLFTIRHLGSGKMWVECSNEGMECDEAQLEGVLEKFWQKHF